MPDRSDRVKLNLILLQCQRVWLDVNTMKRDFWGGMTIAIFAAASGLMLPARVHVLLSDLISERNIWKLTQELGLILLIAGMSLGLSSIRGFVLDRLCLKLTSRMRRLLFHHVLSVAPRSLQEAVGGQIITGFTNDLQLYQNGLRIAVSVILPSTLLIFIYVGALVWFSWQLALLLMFVVLPLVLATNIFAQRIHFVTHRVQMAFGRLLGNITDTLRDTREIKLFGMQRRIIEPFYQDEDDVVAALLGQSFLTALHPFTVSICGILGAAVIAIVSVELIDKGMTSDTNLSGFMVCLVLAYPPIQELSHSLGQIAQYGVARDRLDAILAIPSEPMQEKSFALPRDASLVFNNIYFSYGQGAFALNGINLAIQAGEHIAVVGASGSGKSTLIDLLPRFNIPQRGQILLGGIPLEDIPLTALRAQMGLLSQVPFIFRATLWENLIVGNPDADRTTVLEVARRARVDEFAIRLPSGYETIIEPGGTNLSVGQRQRIAIARVLLKNPPILLLDEPTSALDGISEKFVNEAIEQAAVGRTTITVAHRLSTIQTADRILVMDQGRILEIGRHETLIARGGLYTSLVQQRELNPAARMVDEL